MKKPYQIEAQRAVKQLEAMAADGNPAGPEVKFAGLVFPGEFQINVVVPPNTPDGDQQITATYNGYSTQAGALLTVQH